MNTAADEVKKTAENTKEEIKKSSVDWVNYIKEHPIQSIFFGISVFYAFKGMIQSSEK
jgi:hypothetical protein